MQVYHVWCFYTDFCNTIFPAGAVSYHSSFSLCGVQFLRQISVSCFIVLQATC